jgi:hypothetical protein
MNAYQPQGLTLFGTLAVALTAGVLSCGLSSPARADTATFTTITADPPTSIPGDRVILTATVLDGGNACGAINGTVTFADGSTTLDTVALVNCVAELDVGALALDPHTFKATYNPGSGFTGSNGTVVATVDGTYPELDANNDGIAGIYNDPSATRLSNGNFVMVHGLTAGALIHSGTQFQLYNAQGTPLGGMTRVKPMFISGPASVASINGGFVVTMEYSKYYQGKTQVVAQRYTNAGVRVGQLFQVSKNNPGWIGRPRVAGLSDGGFVIVWDAGSKKGLSGEIYALRYDSQGKKVGKEFIVNTNKVSRQQYPDVTTLANGGFVVAWQSSHAGGNSPDINAQRFGSDGKPVGVEFTINSDLQGAQELPSVVGLSNGGFAAVWTRNHAAYGRRFNAAGTPIETDFEIPGGSDVGGVGRLAAFDDGRFVFTWAASDSDIRARVFSGTGPLDADNLDFGVNQPPVGSHPGTQGANPSAVTLPDGTMFVMWTVSASAGEEIHIKLRQVDVSVD